MNLREAIATQPMRAFQKRIIGICIALAFVDPSVEPGDELTVDVRGQQVPAVCVQTPFVAKR